MVSSILPARSSVTTRDRLGFTLVLAIVLHLMVVFGIGFKDEPTVKPPPMQSMEVIMLDIEAPPEKNENADFLSAVSQQGGGEAEQRLRPTSPPEQPRPEQQVHPGDRVTQVVPLPAQQQPTTPRVLAQARAGSELPLDSDDKLPQQVQPQPNATQLMMRSRQMVSNAISEETQYQPFKRQPRQRYITASSREYSAAAYMESWRRTVERIGNINYPEEARRQGLTGSLILDVAIKPDGRVHEIRVARSSGKKVLDDAAVRIVELAAPYAPFPADIRKETDILHIIRTWQFESDSLAAQ